METPNEDRRIISRNQRRLAIGMDVGIITLVGTCLFWVGQQSKTIETQGEKITDLTGVIQALPEGYVSTRFVSNLVTTKQLADITTELSEVKSEVRENLELSLQIRIRDLNDQTCNLTGSARRILETEVQDLQNRYQKRIGREYTPPRCRVKE
jgi:hypothetical protein